MNYGSCSIAFVTARISIVMALHTTHMYEGNSDVFFVTASGLYFPYSSYSRIPIMLMQQPTY